MGLANWVAEEEPDARAYLAARVAHCARPTLRALKSMVNAARARPLEESLRIEAQLFASTWGQEAHLRALDGNIKHNKSGSEIK